MRTSADSLSFSVSLHKSVQCASLCVPMCVCAFIYYTPVDPSVLHRERERQKKRERGSCEKDVDLKGNLALSDK